LKIPGISRLPERSYAFGQLHVRRGSLRDAAGIQADLDIALLSF
jgi:hypothetical protein